MAKETRRKKNPKGQSDGGIGEAPRSGRKGTQNQERQWSKKVVAAIAIIASVITIVVSILGPPRLASLKRFWGTPDPVQLNVSFLVDTSGHSNAPFDGMTKAQAVRIAISEIRELPSTTNLALRSFGERCDRSGTNLVRQFSVGNGRDLIDALESVPFEGARPLFYGLLEGIGDFSDVKQFGGTTRRIILITSGDDECPSEFPDRPRAYENIRRHLVESGINLELFCIGVGLDEKGQSRLIGLADASGCRVSMASNVSELKAAVDVALRHSESTNSVARDADLAAKLPSASAVVGVSIGDRMAKTGIENSRERGGDLGVSRDALVEALKGGLVVNFVSPVPEGTSPLTVYFVRDTLLDPSKIRLRVALPGNMVNAIDCPVIDLPIRHEVSPDELRCPSPFRGVSVVSAIIDESTLMMKINRESGSSPVDVQVVLSPGARLRH